jgi:hypothetical protein
MKRIGTRFKRYFFLMRFWTSPLLVAPKALLPSCKRFLRQSLAAWPRHSTVSTVKIDLAGNSATARSAAIVPMTGKTPEGKEATSVSGLWYEDSLERTKDGWKIKSRKQVRSWSANMA